MRHQLAGINLKTKIPGPKSQALMERRIQSIPRGPFHTTPVFVESAHGAILKDVDGNTFIDFAAGIGVVNSGHTPETVVKAITEQAQKLIHGSFNVTAYENYIALCEKLNEATPGTHKKKTFLANSGAEAVENAIKIARAFTKRQAVVCFDHAFHGRTYMAMSLTSKVKPYKYDFGPFNSEVHRAPYPYSYRWPTQNMLQECWAQFEDLVNSRIGATQVAAVILEPVLGEGGFVVAPKEFLAKLREFCTKNGIVLIADEIQTGFGRTGTMFACEQLDFIPDLMTIAKGLGGGMPISAVTGKAEIMDAAEVGGIGGTFGGNPLSCAAALAVCDLFQKGNLLKDAKNLAEVLTQRLNTWKNKFPAIGEVRGLGPMMAIELVKDKTTKEPNPELAKKLQKYAYENGVVLMGAGTYGNCIRFLIPLNITMSELNEGLDVIEKGF